jgi:hypothetical protein
MGGCAQLSRERRAKGWSPLTDLTLWRWAGQRFFESSEIERGRSTSFRSERDLIFLKLRAGIGRPPSPFTRVTAVRPLGGPLSAKSLPPYPGSGRIHALRAAFRVSGHSPRAAAAVGAGDPQSGVSRRRRRDRAAPAAGSPRRLEDCYPSAADSVREGCDENSPCSASASPRGFALACHDERDRQPAESHPSRQAQGETLARRQDGGTLGGRRHRRSDEWVPTSAGKERSANVRRRLTSARSTARTRRCHGERRMGVIGAAAEFQQPAGQRLTAISTRSFGLWKNHFGGNGPKQQ